MIDDDQDDILFDWRVVIASGGCRRPGGDCNGRTDRGQRRRLLPAAKLAAPRAKMIPFPLRQRRPFVEKLAEQVASREADAGEAHLLQQLARQREVLRRKGVSEVAIERELRALATAVRTELWRLLLGSGE
jgi:hypothetical protein